MYIKAKYANSKRAYTFQTTDDVKPGDTVVSERGAKLTVVEEPVDEKWLETYGADKIVSVKKYIESEEI